MTTNPPSAHLEQQAREVLASNMIAKPWAGDYTAEFWRSVRVTADEAIAAMLAFRDAPKPAPEHHELREKVAERYGFSGVRETYGRISFVAIVDHHDNEARIAFVPFSNRHPPLRQPDVDLIVGALNAYSLPNPSPDTSELVDGIDPAIASP